MLKNFFLFYQGRSGSGKTTEILNLLERKNQFIVNSFDKVVYVYGIDSPVYHSFKSKNPFITFTDEFDENQIPTNSCVVLYDIQLLISDSRLNKRITEFAIKTVRHCKISLIITLHNLFASSNLRTITLQSEYILLIDSLRDRSSYNKIGYQLFPQNPNFLVKVFQYILSKTNRGKIFIDLSYYQSEKFRIRDSLIVTDATNFFCPSSF